MSENIKEYPNNFLPEEDIIKYENVARKVLENGFKSLKFPGALEKLFSKWVFPNRKMRYVGLGLGAVFSYNLFCITDYFVLPDIYKTAWLIRLAVDTPIILIFLFLIYFKKIQRFIEYILGFIIVLVAASSILIVSISEHPNVQYYQTGIILVVIFGNVVIRIRFWVAMAFSIIIQVLYTLSTLFIISIPPEISFTCSLILFFTIILTLIGNYQMDIEMRKDFLLTLLVHIDTLKMEESNRELKHLSLSDALSGLANRRYFDSAFDQEWRAAFRRKYNISLIFIDIDFFKLYNDNYGHQAGDECLKQIARVLKNYAQRPHDVCARYGGEEFVILLPQTNLSNAIELAERIRINIKNLLIPHEFSEIGSYVTISLGVAEVNPSLVLNDSNYLIELADKALYLAKKNGRNRVCTHLEYN